MPVWTMPVRRLAGGTVPDHTGSGTPFRRGLTASASGKRSTRTPGRSHRAPGRRTAPTGAPFRLCVVSTASNHVLTRLSDWSVRDLGQRFKAFVCPVIRRRRAARSRTVAPLSGPSGASVDGPLKMADAARPRCDRHHTASVKRRPNASRQATDCGGAAMTPRVAMHCLPKISDAVQPQSRHDPRRRGPAADPPRRSPSRRRPTL